MRSISRFGLATAWILTSSVLGCSTSPGNKTEATTAEDTSSGVDTLEEADAPDVVDDVGSPDVAIETPDTEALDTAIDDIVDLDAAEDVTVIDPDADPDADTDADVEAPDVPDTAEPPLVCDPVPALPRPFEILYGFTQGEDFAFDDTGHIVANDGGTLVRQDYAGKKTPFVPGFGETAGMRFLPNGDLIVSNINTGTLDRVTPDGSVTTILTGLDYSNGVEVDSQGYVYTAEQNAGRVRRIDPATSEFIIVGHGMSNPNGTSLSPDESTLYVGSFGAGVVYAVDLLDADHMGATTVYGRVPGISASSGAVVEPCDGIAEGGPCDLGWGSFGKCKPYGGILVCQQVGPCDGAAVGDACGSNLAPSTCKLVDGELTCVEKGKCTGGVALDPCVTASGTTGVCESLPGATELACVSVVCAGLGPAAPCATDVYLGACVASWDGSVDCQWIDTCATPDMVEGGVCVLSDGQPGECVANGPSNGYCAYINLCQQPGALVGQKCVASAWGTPGQCLDSIGAGLSCEPVYGCGGFVAGDPCVPEGGFVIGSCTDAGAELTCVLPPPCDGKVEHDLCYMPNGVQGACAAGASGLECGPPTCADLGAGSSCTTDDGQWGSCVDSGAGLVCEGYNPCVGMPVGIPCYSQLASATVCYPWDDGQLHCGLPTNCDGQPVGVGCDTGSGAVGSCADVSGAATCLSDADVAKTSCKGHTVGDVCSYLIASEGWSGTCVIAASGSGFGKLLRCNAIPNPAVTCAGKIPGALCVLSGQIAYCDMANGTLACGVAPTSDAGGLDGLNVDACGNVYVTQYIEGVVYRFPKGGGIAEPMSALPSSWIPNMHFGTGLGGWKKDRLYVADRDEGRLFAIDIGLPGSPDAFPPVWQP